jgi:hypothetical protein
MSGIEIATLLLCSALCIGQVTTAYWVSKVNALLTRTIAEDKRVRDAQGRNFMTWLAETASAVKAIHVIAASLHGQGEGEKEKARIASETGAAAPPEDTPPTVKYPLRTDRGPAEVARDDAQGDRPSDAETKVWSGPLSSRTLLGVGATQSTEPTQAEMTFSARGGRL